MPRQLRRTPLAGRLGQPLQRRACRQVQLAPPPRRELDVKRLLGQRVVEDVPFAGFLCQTRRQRLLQRRVEGLFGLVAHRVQVLEAECLPQHARFKQRLLGRLAQSRDAISDGGTHGFGHRYRGDFLTLPAPVPPIDVSALDQCSQHLLHEQWMPVRVAVDQRGKFAGDLLAHQVADQPCRALWRQPAHRDAPHQVLALQVAQRAL